MAMNSIGWLPNWFNLDVSEMEQQLVNWCKKNSSESWQIVFNLKDMKAFLKKNKLHKNTDGRHYFFSTPRLVIVWNELQEDWGFVYQIKNSQDFEDILYKAPDSPAKSCGFVYVNQDV